MNDCVFYMMGICECKNGLCNMYCSLNSEKGNEIATEYTLEVEKALEPVRQSMAQKYSI